MSEPQHYRNGNGNGKSKANRKPNQHTGGAGGGGGGGGGHYQQYYQPPHQLYHPHMHPHPHPHHQQQHFSTSPHTNYAAPVYAAGFAPTQHQQQLYQQQLHQQYQHYQQHQHQQQFPPQPYDVTPPSPHSASSPQSVSKVSSSYNPYLTNDADEYNSAQFQAQRAAIATAHSSAAVSTQQSPSPSNSNSISFSSNSPSHPRSPPAFHRPAYAHASQHNSNSNSTSTSTSLSAIHEMAPSYLTAPLPSPPTSQIFPTDNKKATVPSIPPIFSVDVECVANGYTHNDRVIAHIACVDANENCVLNIYVKPDSEVVSYLPLLTGLTKEVVDSGVSLEEAKRLLKQCLPSNCILVGQNILKDVQWLDLQENVDYSQMQDLAGLWRVLHPKYNTFTYFSLSHEAKCLLGLEQSTSTGAHNPVTDSIISIRLFRLWQEYQKEPMKLAKAQQALLNSKIEESFAKRNPVYENVCMGQRKTCKCGGAFFF